MIADEVAAIQALPTPRLVQVLGHLGIATSSWYGPSLDEKQRKRPGPVSKEIPGEVVEAVVKMATDSPAPRQSARRVLRSAAKVLAIQTPCRLAQRRPCHLVERRGAGARSRVKRRHAIDVSPGGCFAVWRNRPGPAPSFSLN